MKVPFLNKKIEAEFQSYIAEFEFSVNSRLASAKENTTSSIIIFRELFPLFAILRGFANSEYVANPARNAILSELLLKGEKEKYLEAISHFNKKQKYHEELLEGLQKQIFTGYFDELFSDILLLLNTFYTSNYRGAFIAIRCLLEDLYRHLYFKDHPQEFWSLNNSNNSSISPRQCREYLRTTSYLNIFCSLNREYEKKSEVNKSDLFDLNDELYSVCSTYVHGAADNTLNAFKTNADLIQNTKREKQVIQVVKDFSELAVAFLISAHFDHFMSFNEYERSMVLTVFSNSRRAAFRKALNI